MATDDSQPRRTRLLACVGTSPHGPSVLRAAGQFADALRAEVTYVHVGVSSLETRRRLAVVLTAVGIDVSPDDVLIRSGPPHEVICNAAGEIGADLVVAGALEQESVIRELFGSTARRVARRAPCSVCLVVQNIEGGPAWRRVVASVNLEETSSEVIQCLVALSKASPEIEVHVVHEYNPHDPGGVDVIGGPEVSGPEAHELRAAAEGFELANFLEKFDFGEVRVVTACLAGREGEELLRYAADIGADLIVTQAPDRPLGLWDRFFGHPAERVLQRLPCSVLIHRRPTTRNTPTVPR